MQLCRVKMLSQNLIPDPFLHEGLIVFKSTNSPTHVITSPCAPGDFDKSVALILET